MRRDPHLQRAGIASKPCAAWEQRRFLLWWLHREVAWQILALNTEKAHNLKERALEVIRIYRGLVDEDATRPESQFAFYLDEAALVTLGVCYERVSRFGGGVYHPILRRLETFTDDPLRSCATQSRTMRNVSAWCWISKRELRE